MGHSFYIVNYRAGSNRTYYLHMAFGQIDLRGLGELEMDLGLVKTSRSLCI